jgi:hypothetical protein
MVVFIAIAALAIDIGQLSTTKNELQNVADSAALAGAAKIGTVYMSITSAEIPTHVFNKSDISDVVQAVALQNRASGVNVVINNNATDIIIGKWNSSTKDIDPEVSQAPGAQYLEPDAVYVKARRDSQANSPITTFFAGILGINTMSVTAEAVASLSGPSSVAEGELQLPIGLSENLFEPQYNQTLCTDIITFSPTPSSCAAWHNFEDDVNGDAMEDKIIGIIEGHTVEAEDCVACGTLSSGQEWMEANYDIRHNPQYPGAVVTPSYNTGVLFEFQGGQISKLLTPGAGYLLPDYDSGLNPGNTGTIEGNTANPQDMTAMFDYFRYRDGDEIDSEWSTTIPVYEDTTVQDGDSTPDCDNATQSRKIVGFAEVSVLQTNPPPDTTLAVRVQCNLVVAEGRGGGGGFSNILGSVPHLVK